MFSDYLNLLTYLPVTATKRETPPRVQHSLEPFLSLEMEEGNRPHSKLNSILLQKLQIVRRFQLPFLCHSTVRRGTCTKQTGGSNPIYRRGNVHRSWSYSRLQHSQQLWKQKIQNEKWAKTQIPQPALDRFNGLTYELVVTSFTWFLVANPYLTVPLVFLWERELTVKRLQSLHQPKY